MYEPDAEYFPNRQSMLQDLTTNYKLKGLTYKQLVDLIGEPEKNLIGDSNEVCYPVLVDYGSDIDPVHTITFVVKLNSDSSVADFKIEEWKK